MRNVRRRLLIGHYSQRVLDGILAASIAKEGYIMTTEEEFRKGIEDRLTVVENVLRRMPSARTPGGGPYSALRRRLDKLALRVEALIEFLQEQHPEEYDKFEEFCNNYKSPHEAHDDADYDEWQGFQIQAYVTLLTVGFCSH